MRRRPSSRARQGFTLLEALLALGMILLALTFAAQLLLESRNLLEDSSRRARDPQPKLALAQLRHDLQGAALVVSTGSGWSSGALVLVGSGAGTIRYAQRGTALERTVVNTLGVESSRRVMLSPVESWRWREAAPGLVDVEVTTAEHRRVPELRVAPMPRNPSERRWALRAALRGRERIRSW